MNNPLESLLMCVHVIGIEESIFNKHIFTEQIFRPVMVIPGFLLRIQFTHVCKDKLNS